MAYLKTLMLFPNGKPSRDDAVVLDHPQQLETLPEELVADCPLAVVVLDSGRRYAIRRDQTGYEVKGPLDDYPLAEALERQTEPGGRSATLGEAIQDILFIADMDRFSSVRAVSQN